MATDSSLLQSLSEAQGLYISGVYALSRDKFTTILNSHHNNYEALLYRGYANLKLNALEESLKDAEAAIGVNSNRSEALLLKGIVLFHQGKLDAALSEVQRAKLILSSLEASDARRLDAEKWERTIEAEKTKRTAINANNLVKKVEEQKTEKTNGAPAQFHPHSGKVTYKWRQTDNRVYIDINFGLKKKEDLNVKIEARRVEISFPIQESKSFELNLDLFDEIDTAASLYNVHLDRIEVQLEKINKGRNWTFLEKSDSQNERVLETAAPKPVQQTQAPQAVASYPSSSKVKRDWNKIDKEIDEDMKKNKDEYAEGDQLNAFFQQLYANSDENTRRAMMKSFQTSGGTVLSNNWDEVKDKDYEGKDRPSAPEGQEYRQWGK